MAHEQSGVLEVRTVVGVGVEDELGFGQELLQDVGVDGRDDDVVAAVDDEDGEPEALEVGVAGIPGGAVRRERGPLGGDRLVGDGRVAVGAGGDPVDVSAPSCLAGGGLPELCGKNRRSRRSRLPAPLAFFPFAIAGGT